MMYRITENFKDVQETKQYPFPMQKAQPHCAVEYTSESRIRTMTFHRKGRKGDFRANREQHYSNFQYKQPNCQETKIRRFRK